MLSFHFISFHFISVHFISFRFFSFHLVSFRVISFIFVSFHFISVHFIYFRSFHFISFVSFRFVSFHLVLIRVISFLFVSFFVSFRFIWSLNQSFIQYYQAISECTAEEGGDENTDTFNIIRSNILFFHGFYGILSYDPLTLRQSGGPLSPLKGPLQIPLLLLNT